MNLKQLLCGIRYVTVQGDAENTDVKAICIDTRDMIYGSVFVCIAVSYTHLTLPTT